VTRSLRPATTCPTCRDQIRQFLPNPFATLGADGPGFSDTRPAARRYFHIDTHSMVVRALQMLAEADQIDSEAPGKAAERYQLLDVTAGTTGNVGGDA
jgi:pyruvate dehydrogenase E1 component